jgi:hypothetical protein
MQSPSGHAHAQRSRVRTPLGLALLAALLVASGCASFKPRPLEELGFRDRAQTQSRDGITVTVSVLSRDESKHAFGVDLAKRGIQPVWVEIQNDSDVGFYFMLFGLDPGYYSPRDYLSEDLAGSQAVHTLGHVAGVGAATADEPHYNLMHASFWTDGQRAVYLRAPYGSRPGTEPQRRFQSPQSRSSRSPMAASRP